MGKNLLSVRITSEISEELDKMALQYGTTRSKIVRELLENAKTCYEYVELEKVRKREATQEQYDQLIERVMKNLADKITPDIMHTVGVLANQVAERLSMEEKGGGKSKK
jgi:predicted DNA-binding protein